MNAEQVHLIRKSFAAVERHRGLAALVFYQRLFELDPALRSLFHSDIEEQAEKLMDMLGVLVGRLEHPASLQETLEHMGARHAGYGVRDEHYGIVGRALLDMLAEVMGPTFTPEARQAWSDLYELIAQSMMRGAHMAQTT